MCILLGNFLPELLLPLETKQGQHHQQLTHSNSSINHGMIIIKIHNNNNTTFLKPLFSNSNCHSNHNKPGDSCWGFYYQPTTTVHCNKSVCLDIRWVFVIAMYLYFAQTDTLLSKSKNLNAKLVECVVGCSMCCTLSHLYAAIDITTSKTTITLKLIVIVP